jgi:branched-chain amino acid transport system permease protein
MVRLALGAGIVLLLVAPAVVYPVFLMKVLCYAMLAASLNLLLGYVGLLSFGHAMFFGTAAYVCAHVVKVWGWDVTLGLLAGTASAAALAALTGLLAIRRMGIAFSMITLAFAQLVYFGALRAPFTGGENGIQDVPRRALLGVLDINGNLTLYYVVLAIAVFAFWLVFRIVHSPLGGAQAIRDNERRALSLGYQVGLLLAFVLSAALGIAGNQGDRVPDRHATDVGFGISGGIVDDDLAASNHGGSAGGRRAVGQHPELSGGPPNGW